MTAKYIFNSFKRGRWRSSLLLKPKYLDEISADMTPFILFKIIHLYL